MRTFNRILRILSVVTLFFFCWTYLPLFEVAVFAATQKEPGGLKIDGSPGRQRADQSDERFEKALQEIRTELGVAVQKTERSEDASGELERIGTRKAEIEALDAELRKEFSATEKKLREANLPQEILDRHARFVKHYEDDLVELRAGLDAVKAAKTNAQLNDALQKAKTHLEKTKPARKQVPLDPNKLPHRTVKAKERAPRLKKEEFEKEFPPQRPNNLAIDEHGRTRIVDSSFSRVANGHEWTRIKHKPVLLALNDVASDVPFTLGSDAFNPQPVDGLLTNASIGNNPQLAALSFGLEPLNLAAVTAIDAPTAADLAETIEVQFTPAITAKAQELDYSPVKIYEWVRNNVEYVPTYGSIQGADMCLQTKQCNDFDTASLLIALLRTSGVFAHYVYGTVDIPIEKLMNWVGGFSDPMSALNFVSSGGLPVKGITVGGKILTARMEHVWVEAWVDYIPSRGSVQKKGDTWIVMDASFKQYNYTQGMDLMAAVPFDGESFVQQIKNTATINETERYITNVNTAYVRQQMQDYATSVENYISTTKPSATLGDVIGKKTIVFQPAPYLLGTLPYKTVLIGAKYASLPDSLRHRVTFSVTSDNLLYDPSPLTLTKTLPELAGKKITLGYTPATSSDEALIKSYLPKPHADGTPIQPNELAISMPAYLVHLKPELRLDGVVVATGGTIGMGEEEYFSATLQSPTLSPERVQNTVIAGEYDGIAVDMAAISAEQSSALKSRMDQTKTRLEAEGDVSREEMVGDMLYGTMLSYFAQIDLSDSMTAKSMKVATLRHPSIGRYFVGVNVSWMFGVPSKASLGGMTMDVGLINAAVVPLNGDNAKTKDFMTRSGSESSAFEHLIPEQLFSTKQTRAQGISAVKALQLANDQGMPIYTIDKTNINIVLPKLGINQEAKSDIINAVSAGKTATVSKTNINFNGWVGCGYVIQDTITGAAAYMISGGLYGGSLVLVAVLMFFAIAYLALAIAFTGGLAFFLFAFIAFGFAFGALVAFFGHDAANEFIGCLVGIIATDLALHFVQHAWMILITIFDVLLVLLLQIGLAAYEYSHCLEELYSTMAGWLDRFKGKIKYWLARGLIEWDPAV